MEHTTTTSATTVTTTTVTWPKNDVRLKKIKQKDIHTYLASKISAEELDQLPTRSRGWVQAWRDCLWTSAQSLTTETIEVPTHWDQPATTPQEVSNSDPPSTTDGFIIWQQTDCRLNALKLTQIRDYLKGKIAEEDHERLVALRSTKWTLEKWRNRIVSYAKTLPGETIEVPCAWSTTQPPKTKRGGITTELDLKDYVVVKVYCDLESTG